MNWFWISVGSLGAILYVIGKGRRHKKRARVPVSDKPKKGALFSDRVQQAVDSGDLAAMASLVKQTDDPLLRHTLLEPIVAAYYRQRSDPASKKEFYRYAHQHIDLAPDLLKALDKGAQDRPDRIDAFKMLAIALGEDGRYQAAIDVCRAALSFGLEDGTKTGFEGRITRLTRRMGSES
jgi:hypothetical protein